MQPWDLRDLQWDRKFLPYQFSPGLDQESSESCYHFMLNAKEGEAFTCFSADSLHTTLEIKPASLHATATSGTLTSKQGSRRDQLVRSVMCLSRAYLFPYRRNTDGLSWQAHSDPLSTDWQWRVLCLAKARPIPAPNKAAERQLAIFMPYCNHLLPNWFRWNLQ